MEHTSRAPADPTDLPLPFPSQAVFSEPSPVLSLAGKSQSTEAAAVPRIPRAGWGFQLEKLCFQFCLTKE